LTLVFGLVTASIIAAAAPDVLLASGLPVYSLPACGGTGALRWLHCSGGTVRK
jgi:hypothetical protein